MYSARYQEGKPSEDDVISGQTIDQWNRIDNPKTDSV